jgi:hypothetical protein
VRGFAMPCSTVAANSALGLRDNSRHHLDCLQWILSRWPSPDSMTASVPSNTALATSLASARVGRGFSVMTQHLRGGYDRAAKIERGGSLF